MAAKPAWFWHWVAWRLRNKQGPRPADVPATIPHWAWLALERWVARHKPKPPHPPQPPPPPVPKSRWTKPPWRGTGVHVAWAFSSGQFTPQQLADKIAGSKIQWAALEVNPAVDNEQYIDAFAAALHAHGRRLLLWERDDTQKSYDGTVADHAVRLCTDHAVDGYGADIEVFPVDEPTFPAEFAKRLPDMPRIAICAGLADASFYTSWVNNDWDCMTEAYSGPLGKPPVPGVAGSMDSDAKWRGFKQNWLGFHSVPILEVESENSASLKDQLPAVTQWGDNFSIWDVESMTDEDWAQLAA
jgi:hypothetical protein